MRRFMAMVMAVSMLGMAAPAMAEQVWPAKAQKKVDESTGAIGMIMDTPDKGIPPSMLRKAVAVAIFPGVIKAGFLVGGRHGRGVILRHDKATNRWSPPAFFSIDSNSFGWQIGAQSNDVVLVIVSEKGLHSLLGKEATLGGDASVAPGPVGRKAEAGAGQKSAIYSYSRSRGVFAGVSLEGTKLHSLGDFNRAYYGKPYSARDILLGGKVSAPKGALPLMQNLRKYAQ